MTIRLIYQRCRRIVSLDAAITKAVAPKLNIQHLICFDVDLLDRTKRR